MAETDDWPRLCQFELYTVTPPYLSYLGGTSPTLAVTDGGDAQGFDWAFFYRIPLWLSSKYSNIGKRDVSYEKRVCPNRVNSKLKHYLEVKRCQQKDL